MPKVEHEKTTVLISEEGGVYPLIEIFDTPSDDLDDEILKELEVQLPKQGKLLGTFYYPGDEYGTPVIIFQDNSVRPFVELAMEGNPEGEPILAIIRRVAKIRGYRLGTAYMPPQDSEDEE